MRVAAKNVGDRFVAIFFAVGTRGQQDQPRRAEKTHDLPFLATIFHTVGLNVMDPSERRRDVLDASTRALRDMTATSWLRTEPVTDTPAEILRTSVNSEARWRRASSGCLQVHHERIG